MVKRANEKVPASKASKKVPNEENMPKETSELLNSDPVLKDDGERQEITSENQLYEETTKEQLHETAGAEPMEAENQPGTSNECEENEIKTSAKVIPENVKSVIVSTEIAKLLPNTCKRKPDVEVQNKSKITPVKSKAKRQKLFLDIPQAKSIPGKVFVIGENVVGQLGFGEDVEYQKRPTLLELSQSIVDVAAGGMHSVCLTESGEVLTFGCNDEGALGRVTVEEESERIPQKVDIPEPVIQISAGDSHSAALTESGQVFLWGNFRNEQGVMGLITEGTKQETPTKILNDVTIVKISSGSDHLVCLSTGGVVYTCGCGDSGQLGRISERSCPNEERGGYAVLLVPREVYITRSDGTDDVLIDEVWTGCSATFLKQHESSSIFACGLNSYNQLGYENEQATYKPKEVTSFTNLQGQTCFQIDGDQHHTLALDARGLVYALGCKDYGRLGLGEDSGHTSIPTVITTLQNEKCVDISCGNCVSFSVTEQGSVYSWGMGSNHQLGHGDDSDCLIPRLIEGNFLNSWKALKVVGGGQHTLILACSKENKEKKK